MVEPGTVVGELAEGWALPATLPVVAGLVEPVALAVGAGALAADVAVEAPGRAVVATAAPVTGPGLVATATVERWVCAAASVAELEAALGRSLRAVPVGPETAALARTATWLVQRAVGAHGHPPPVASAAS